MSCGPPCSSGCRSGSGVTDDREDLFHCLFIDEDFVNKFWHWLCMLHNVVVPTKLTQFFVQLLGIRFIVVFKFNVSKKEKLSFIG